MKQLLTKLFKQKMTFSDNPIYITAITKLCLISKAAVSYACVRLATIFKQASMIKSLIRQRVVLVN